MEIRGPGRSGWGEGPVGRGHGVAREGIAVSLEENCLAFMLAGEVVLSCRRVFRMRALWGLVGEAGRSRGTDGRFRGTDGAAEAADGAGVGTDERRMGADGSSIRADGSPGAADERRIRADGSAAGADGGCVGCG